MIGPALASVEDRDAHSNTEQKFMQHFKLEDHKCNVPRMEME